MDCTLLFLWKEIEGNTDMGKVEERFVVIHKEGSQLKDEGFKQLLVDKETGVTYLLWKAGYGSAITPLYNEDGTFVITKL